MSNPLFVLKFIVFPLGAAVASVLLYFVIKYLRGFDRLWLSFACCLYIALSLFETFFL